MHFNIVLNQPDAGEISVNLNDPDAVDVTIGRLIKMVYRGAPIGSGGFFIENIVDDIAAPGDRNGQWKKVSGRGGLAILDDGIVWSITDSSRTFTAQKMAAILLTLINEAKARGCFPTMRTEFSATHDSSGALWTDTTTITLNTGTSLLDVARQFSELGLEFKLIFDWVLGDYALYAYGSALGTDKSAGVVVYMGHNAQQLSESRESSALKNAFLVSYQAGITSTTDAASIATYRRRETFFQAGNAPSSGSALILAGAELAARKDPVHSITVKLDDGANPPRFDVDYQVGDWIGVDWADGNVPSVYRVRAASLEWLPGKKYANITLTLNSIKLEMELRTAIAMRKIANGSTGGGTSSAPPDAKIAVDVHDADASAHSSRPLAGDLGGTLNAPAVMKLNGVALDNPLTHSDKQILTYNLGTDQIEFSSNVPMHHTTHESGGADAIKLDDLAAPDDNTDLDASITKHGLMKKFPGGTTNFLREDGTFTAPAGGGDVVQDGAVTAGHVAVFSADHHIEDGGIAFSAARYNSNAAQNIVNNAAVAIINFEDQVYDTDSAVTIGASWKYTAPAAGYYHIDVMALLAASTGFGGGERVLLQLFKNNSLLVLLDRQDNFTGASGQGIAKGSVTLNLSAGDYIDIRIAQNSGGDIALSNDPTQVWINIEKIG